jgi:transcription elongation factor
MVEIMYGEQGRFQPGDKVVSLTGQTKGWEGVVEREGFGDFHLYKVVFENNEEAQFWFLPHEIEFID